MTPDAGAHSSRRAQLTDAGLTLLAEQGMRGLTHRAVDRQAGLPEGTCSNYFRRRAELIGALADRIIERLTPDDDHLNAQTAIEASREQWVRLMLDLVDRARAQPELHVALWELRLEATRRPELRDPLAAVIRRGFDADIAFHERTHLPGGPEEIVMLHLALNGLILETLTLPGALPIDDIDALVTSLVERLVYAGSG